MSQNVSGLDSPYKCRALWKSAMDIKCDILCAQETHFSSSKPPNCTRNTFPQVFTANNSSKKNGVLIAIRDTITFSLLQDHVDPQGCFIILVAELNHATYTLVNLYAPNVKPVKFIRKVVKLAKSMHKGNLIICRDFNMVLNGELDSSTVAHRQKPSLGPFCHEERLFDP